MGTTSHQRASEAYSKLLHHQRDRLALAQAYAEKRDGAPNVYEMELMALHARKLCEGVVLGSLIAQTTVTEKLVRRHKFAQSLHGLINDVERVNPHWLPQAADADIGQGTREHPHHLRPSDARNLTRTVIERAYICSSRLVHLHNPLHHDHDHLAELPDLIAFQARYAEVITRHAIFVGGQKIVLLAEAEPHFGGNLRVVIAVGDDS